jgi:hypothetical protein
MEDDMELEQMIAELNDSQHRERAAALSVAGKILSSARRAGLSVGKVEAYEVVILAQFILEGELEQDQATEEELADLREGLTRPPVMISDLHGDAHPDA